MAIGGVLTAAVTPFDAQGGVDEDAWVRLLGHLAENGSDGVVVAGTTGESSTLSDDEKIRLCELAVQEWGEQLFVVAGTGSNDTAHTIHLTERASDVGVDACLVVTPYYNKPPLRGIRRHYEEVAKATDKPLILYNIPSRVVIDLPNAFLAELAEIDGVQAVKQARGEDIEPIPGLDLLAGNDDDLAEVLDKGGSGGILVGAHFIAREMRRMIDEPESRAQIHEQVVDVLNALSVAPLTMSVKAGLNLLGIQVGGCRLPLVECDEQETAAIRSMLERQGLLSAV